MLAAASPNALCPEHRRRNTDVPHETAQNLILMLRHANSATKRQVRGISLSTLSESKIVCCVADAFPANLRVRVCLATNH